MNLNLNNKKALITGASRGIGLAIAENFLKEGAKACLVSRGSDNLFLAEKKIQKIYGIKKSFSASCDCTDVNSLNLLREKIVKKWNVLDILVVNVGDGRSVPDALPSQEQWEKTWNNPHNENV